MTQPNACPAPGWFQIRVENSQLVQWLPTVLTQPTRESVAKLTKHHSFNHSMPPLHKPLVEKSEQFEQTDVSHSVSVSDLCLVCCARPLTGGVGAEILVLFPGLKNLDTPRVWVFPKLSVCLDCGFRGLPPRKRIGNTCRRHSDNSIEPQSVERSNASYSVAGAKFGSEGAP
jgi:hypothetical protein